MIILKFKHSDSADAYHLFESREHMMCYLEDNYQAVREYSHDNSFACDMVIMELDGMPLTAYVVEPLIHKLCTTFR